MKGHEEQVAEGNHQLLRPGSGDLVWPEREKIGPRRTGMADCGGHASRIVDRVGIGEEQVDASRIGGLRELMARPVLPHPALRKIGAVNQPQPS